jgi:hypothetical protein
MHYCDVGILTTWNGCTDREDHEAEIYELVVRWWGDIPVLIIESTRGIQRNGVSWVGFGPPEAIVSLHMHCVSALCLASGGFEQPMLTAHMS